MAMLGQMSRKKLMSPMAGLAELISSRVTASSSALRYLPALRSFLANQGHTDRLSLWPGAPQSESFARGVRRRLLSTPRIRFRVDAAAAYEGHSQ